MKFDRPQLRAVFGVASAALLASTCLPAVSLARPAIINSGKTVGKKSTTSGGTTTTTSGSTTTTSGSTTTTTDGGLVTTTSSGGTVDTTTTTSSGTTTTTTTSSTSTSSPSDPTTSTSTTTTSATTAQIKVYDTASLNAAIKAATTPVTLLLAPGSYDAIIVSAKSGITLQSASNTSPAVLRALTIKGSSNITVDNIKIAGANTNLQYRLYVYQSNGVSLSRISIPGVAGTFDEPLNTAIMIRLSSNVTLSQYLVSWAFHGVSFLDCSNLTIQNGVIRDMRTDGIRGGGIHGLVIQGNDISQFHPVTGDHPDGIQLWSTNETESATDITIQDNLVSRDNGGIAQGIFIRDTYLTLPFLNVKVANNVIAGGMYNGIMISGTITARFQNNKVIGFPDMKSWIRVEYAQDASVEDSQANQFVLATGVGSGGNMIVPQDVTTADQAVAAWRAAHGY